MKHSLTPKPQIFAFQETISLKKKSNKNDTLEPLGSEKSMNILEQTHLWLQYPHDLSVFVITNICL